MLGNQYKEELIWKQKFSNELAEFRKKAYQMDNLMPKRYVLVLTNLCNLACDFCYQIRKKQKNALNSKDWIKLIKQLPENSRVTLTGGEPLVFKNFNDVFLETTKRHECNLICNGLLLTTEIIDLLLSYKNFKVLSISIDNRNNTIRKGANIKEKNWDKKWKHVEEMMFYFQKRKRELNHPTCILADLQGPKLRIGNFVNKKESLKKENENFCTRIMALWMRGVSMFSIFKT